MIYQEHESTFAKEMLKYLDPVGGKQNNFGTIQLSNDIAADICSTCSSCRPKTRPGSR